MPIGRFSDASEAYASPAFSTGWVASTSGFTRREPAATWRSTSSRLRPSVQRT